MIEAQSWLRNAEWSTRRVSTALRLTQPTAGMYGEQVETPSSSRDVQVLPRATHATHPRNSHSASLSVRESGIWQPCFTQCENRNVIEGRSTRCSCSSGYNPAPASGAYCQHRIKCVCEGCHTVVALKLTLVLLFLCHLCEHHSPILKQYFSCIGKA